MGLGAADMPKKRPHSDGTGRILVTQKAIRGIFTSTKRNLKSSIRRKKEVKYVKETLTLENELITNKT